jgi:hypothetical protein
LIGSQQWNLTCIPFLMVAFRSTHPIRLTLSRRL